MDKNYIKYLNQEFNYGRDYPSVVTKSANNFIRYVKSYGWNDKEFINGYQYIKWVKVIVKFNGRIQTTWNFIIGKEPNGKVGYIVNSWLDQFDLQVSKEDGNTAYLMIMEKAKQINGVEIVIENLIK